MKTLADSFADRFSCRNRKAKCTAGSGNDTQQLSCFLFSPDTELLHVSEMVSDWILTPCQPHGVISGRVHSGEREREVGREGGREGERERGRQREMGEGCEGGGRGEGEGKGGRDRRMVGGRERERQRQRQRQTDRQTETERQRERDRQTETETERVG